MKVAIGLALAILSTSPDAVAAPRPSANAGATRGVSNAALAAAARATPVADIDYDLKRCDPRTVEQWLRALVGRHVRAIVWTGGACSVVGPGIDEGSHWCADATIILAHPRNKADRPMIEVFFEKPVSGHPGVAYAFRGVMQAADGDDMSRFRYGFEADWTSRFPAPPGAIVDCPDGQ